jgi:hypothetical protein
VLFRSAAMSIAMALLMLALLIEDER